MTDTFVRIGSTGELENENQIRLPIFGQELFARSPPIQSTTE